MFPIVPSNHLNIRPLFSVVVTQSVTDSLANQKPTIMGYRTSHETSSERPMSQAMKQLFRPFPLETVLDD
jgi:hypothetical protein